MLNANQERELAYVVLIDDILPIEGYDRVETAVVGGWHIIVQKGQFNIGDPAIYFEIDSKVPADKECFAFLEKRHYKIKTLKMCKTISQGLLMHAEDFGWKNTPTDSPNTEHVGIIDDAGICHHVDDESRFLTDKLGVIYAEAEDNQRKSIPIDKYKKMAQRHPKIFKRPLARWLMRREWGKKLMFCFFGKARTRKNGWPNWVAKTDEERVQNMPWILEDTGYWVLTEKIDGTSTTFTMKRGRFGKKHFYVCSRNVCFDSVDKPSYYDINVYWEMAQKYDIYNVLSDLLDIYPCDWITIQGETYGEGVQKRTYSVEGRDFAAFNLILSDRGRLGTLEMVDILTEFNVPCVPVLDIDFTFDELEGRDKVAEVLDMADYTSTLDNGPAEGIVFRSVDGNKSFKAVYEYGR